MLAGLWTFAGNLYAIIRGSDAAALNSWFGMARLSYMTAVTQSKGPQQKHDAEVAMANSFLWIRPYDMDEHKVHRQILLDCSNFLWGLYHHLKAANVQTDADRQRQGMRRFMEDIARGTAGWGRAARTVGLASGRYFSSTGMGRWANIILESLPNLPWMTAKYVTADVALAGPGHKEYGCDEVLQTNALVPFSRIDRGWTVTTLVSGDGNANATYTHLQGNAMPVASLWTTAQQLVLDNGQKLEVVAWSKSLARVYEDFAKAVPALVRCNKADLWQGQW